MVWQKALLYQSTNQCHSCMHYLGIGNYNSESFQCTCKPSSDFFARCGTCCATDTLEARAKDSWRLWMFLNNMQSVFILLLGNEFDQTWNPPSTWTNGRNHHNHRPIRFCMSLQRDLPTSDCMFFWPSKVDWEATHVTHGQSMWPGALEFGSFVAKVKIHTYPYWDCMTSPKTSGQQFILVHLQSNFIL